MRRLLLGERTDLVSGLSENADQLARKLADAGPSEAEAREWVAEVVAEAVEEWKAKYNSAANACCACCGFCSNPCMHRDDPV